MKRLFSLILILMLAASLASCSDADGQEPVADTDTSPETSQTGQEEYPEGTMVFDMEFVDPDTSPYVQGAVKMDEYLNEATEGKLRIRVTSSSEHGEGDLVAQALDGDLDIATCANSVLTNYIPQMNILDQAYLWKNSDEAHAAVDGGIGELIQKEAEPLGLHIIGFEESGFRNTFSTRPIRSMSDFSGIRIRTMKNKYHQAAFESFGAEAVPMDYSQVFGALKDGSIDACENATANCLNSGYYEVTKNVTNTQHAFVYIVLCMSDVAWNRIPEEYMDAFTDSIRKGVEWERNRLTEANEEARAELEKLGVSFYDIDIEELQRAYRSAADRNGFVFDDSWQKAVDEAIASVK